MELIPQGYYNAVAIESLTELIEMHQHLKAIEATTEFLGAFNHAIEFSRCKHNVALIGILALGEELNAEKAVGVVLVVIGVVLVNMVSEKAAGC